MPGFQVDSWPGELSSLRLSVQMQLIRGKRGTLFGFKPTLSSSPSTFLSLTCLYQTTRRTTALFPRVVRSNGDDRESLKTWCVFFSSFLCSLWNQKLGQKVLPGISSARERLIKITGVCHWPMVSAIGMFVYGHWLVTSTTKFSYGAGKQI